LPHRLAVAPLYPARREAATSGRVRLMSRTPIATLAGAGFVLAYVAVAVTLAERLPRMHWVVEALYWCVAGIIWVFPIRWLMLWAVGKR
jgi:hypothetical protein